MDRLWIGTSGWTYQGWRKTFYPEQVRKSDWLSWYAGQFHSVEINGSFYRTPSQEAIKAWKQQTPEDFLFAWKASKFITHWKRLSEKCRNSLDLLELSLKALEPKIGVVLFQLPPQFQVDRERLASFLKMLRKKRKYAFEFRHPSWYQTNILKLLADQNVALCISDHHDAPAPWETTAEHVYLRGHGPLGNYKDRYAKRMLQQWEKTIRVWQKKKWDIFCYFDNDQKTAAPKDAKRLIEMLED
jgi:uncharacterized protein YecE (DUF72 family)